MPYYFRHGTSCVYYVSASLVVAAANTAVLNILALSRGERGGSSYGYQNMR